MKTLPWLLGLVLLASCSSTSQQGFVVVSINTGDLALPLDSETIGLYISQIDESGRASNLLASEQHVTRNNGVPSVRFPSSLVVVSNGKSSRIHTRLVAYDGNTRNVLTMRESRTLVPTDSSALLRLNLFYTNQGNVIDDLPGQVVATSEHASIEAEPTLQLRQSDSAGADPYARFHSVCDGARAPEGMTAGDDGRCVPLDASAADLSVYDAAIGVPFSHESDSCYDVLKTFEPRSDGGAVQLAAKGLPETGECRVELPRAFDPARLNVAMAGLGGFPATDEYPGGLRPLAATLAFRQEGTSIVLPERVCALARRGSLVFSQRTVQWRGVEPVCSEYTLAKQPLGFDNPPPDPRRELDPDGAAPDGLRRYDIAATERLFAFAARKGVVGYLLNTPGDSMKLARLPESAFASGTTQRPEVYEWFPSIVPSLQAVTVGIDGPAEIYAVEALAYHVPAMGFVPERVTGPQADHRGSFVQFGGEGYFASVSSDTPMRVQLGALTNALTVSVPSHDYELPVSTFFGIAPWVGAATASRIVIPNTLDPSQWLDCPLRGQCTPHQFGITQDRERLASSVVAGAAHVAGEFTALYEMPADEVLQSDLAATQPVLASVFNVRAVARFVSAGDGYCAVIKPNDAALLTLSCGLSLGVPATTVLRGPAHIVVDSDESFLYVAYQCRNDSDVHVVEVPFARLNEPLSNVCAAPSQDGG